jgi:casein kinase II subunit beta
MEVWDGEDKGQDSSTESSQLEAQSWVSWLCTIPGNKYLCEVDTSFIEDSFNLYGLKQSIGQSYGAAMEIITDRSGKI